MHAVPKYIFQPYTYTSFLKLKLKWAQKLKLTLSEHYSSCPIVQHTRPWRLETPCYLLVVCVSHWTVVSMRPSSAYTRLWQVKQLCLSKVGYCRNWRIKCQYCVCLAGSRGYWNNLDHMIIHHLDWIIRCIAWGRSGDNISKPLWTAFDNDIIMFHCSFLWWILICVNIVGFSPTIIIFSSPFMWLNVVCLIQHEKQ